MPIRLEELLVLQSAQRPVGREKVLYGESNGPSQRKPAVDGDRRDPLHWNRGVKYAGVVKLRLVKIRAKWVLVYFFKVWYDLRTMIMRPCAYSINATGSDWGLQHACADEDSSMSFGLNRSRASCRLGGRKDGHAMSDRCVTILFGDGDKSVRCAAHDSTCIVALST